MTSSPEFLDSLQVAIDKKIAELEKKTLPSFKNNSLTFHSHYKAVYEMLINKGVLRADPYKNDRHLSDIQVPDDTPLSEAEIEDQLYIRLAEYEGVLDFFVNYTQFSLDDLSLKKIKVIVAIIKYINWGNLIATNGSSTTRGTAAVMEKIRLGTDSVASGVLSSNHSALDRLSKQLQRELKEIADFKKEEYKFKVRTKVVPAAHITPTMSKEDFAKHVKASFAKALPGETFFTELINDLYDDLQLEKTDSGSSEILARFKVEDVKKQEAPKVNLLAILLEGLRTVGTSSRHLDEAVAKLEENNQVLKNRPRTFMEKFKQWIVSLSGQKNKETEMVVELIDPVSTVKKSETILFESFCTSVTKKSRVYSALAARGSSLYQRFESASEEESYDYLNRCLKEIRDFYDRLDALDLVFKTDTPATERSKLRGIKTELGAIKNSIAAINQKLHEFIARKEEIEQLKKLGIKA